jgi:dihydropteroate synthase
MTDAIYLRPTGLLTGTAAANACAAGAAHRLAGGPVAFSAAELIRRREGQGSGRVSALLAIDGLRLSRLRVEDAAAVPAINSRLRAIAEPRAPFAGLSLDRPRIMGVINTTPDSFSDGGRFADPARAIAHGLALMEAGADILDIGGESTRPGAAPISLAEELDRTVPVVEALARAGAVVSIDTRHAAVMRAALSVGARIVNDITALSGDPESLAAVAASKAAVVLMHMQGEPRTMQQEPRYRDAPLDIYDELATRVAACAAAGIASGRIAVDPGIGFGKTVQHNVEILADLALFHGLGAAVLLGVSRKSFIGRLSRGEDAANRIAGSLAAALAGLERGVQILRVHDVAETAQAVAIWRAIAEHGGAL